MIGNPARRLVRTMTALGVRVPVGRINEVFAEPGTIMGPMLGQYLVALSTDERGTVLGYATQDDLRGVGPEPRSVAEHRYWSQAAAMYGQYREVRGP